VKQATAISLLLLYFTSAAGMLINVHYCGKQVAKVSVLNFAADKGCDCNPGNKGMDCCRNYKLYNKADNHKNIQVISVPATPVVSTATLSIPNLLLSIPADNSFVPAIPHYLRSCSRPVYLLNRIL